MENIFQTRLKEAMNLRGFNQTKLARVSGLSKPLICKYIKGEYKASNTNLVKLSNALNVNAGWLLGLSIDMQKKDGQQPPLNNKYIEDIVDILKDQDEETLEKVLAMIKLMVK